MKKRNILVLLLLLINCSLFAFTSVYHFDIDGKSIEYFLKEEMGIPDSEEFKTVEEALTKADSYRQTMINSRLFLSTEYDYQINGNQIDVTFHVQDSKTRLILPYPKYDSNTGLSIKVKGEEKNLFGTFGKASAWVGIMREPFEDESSASLGNYSTSFELATENFILGNNAFSGDLYAYMNMADIKSFTSNLTVSSVSKIGKFTLTPSVTLYNLNFVDFNNSYIGMSVGFGGMDFNLGDIEFNNSINISTYITKADKFYIDSISDSLSGTKDKLYLSNGLVFYPHAKAMDNTTTVGYRISNCLATQSALEFYHKFENKDATFLDLSLTGIFSKNIEGVATTLTLTDAQRLYPVAKQSINYVKGAMSLGCGALNYYYKDFRYGTTFNFIADARQRLFGDVVSDLFDYKRFRAEVVSFPLDSSWLNPSFRFVASASSVPFSSYSSTSGYGYDYNKTTMPEGQLSTYMRGIRDNNETSLGISASEVFLAMNANVTIKFISLGKFVDTYATAFCDFALMTQGETALKDLSFSKLVTVGVEGIGVLTNHPSYPMRLSLGFNVESFVNWLNTKEGKPEYEIFFGLYHFF